MVATVLLLGLLGVASITDLRGHKIYNKTTYPGSLAALGLNLLGTLWQYSGDADPGWLETTLGWIGVGQCVVGFLACGSVMLVCFVLFNVSGGDVKLIAMIGAFLGPNRGIEAMLWTFVLGAAMAMVLLVCKVGPLRLAARAFQQAMWSLRLGRWNPLSPEERAELQSPLYLAPCALVGVMVVLFSWVEYL